MTSVFVCQTSTDRVATKLVELTPLAVAELEYQLRRGDDKQRAEMAKEVLDRSGFGKKEGGNIAASPILIVNAVGGKIELPWERGVVKDVTPVSVASEVLPGVADSAVDVGPFAPEPVAPAVPETLATTPAPLESSP